MTQNTPSAINGTDLNLALLRCYFCIRSHWFLCTSVQRMGSHSPQDITGAIASQGRPSPKSMMHIPLIPTKFLHFPLISTKFVHFPIFVQNFDALMHHALRVQNAPVASHHACLQKL